MGLKFLICRHALGRLQEPLEIPDRSALSSCIQATPERGGHGFQFFERKLIAVAVQPLQVL